MLLDTVMIDYSVLEQANAMRILLYMYLANTVMRTSM